MDRAFPITYVEYFSNILKNIHTYTMFIAYCECQASPPRPVPSTPIGSTTPWLVNPGGMSSVPNVSTSSQFTYATSAPFPPSTTAPSASYFPVPIHLQQQNSQYPPQPQQFSQFQPQVQPTVIKPPQYTYQTGYQAPFPTPNIFALPQQQQVYNYVSRYMMI